MGSIFSGPPKPAPIVMPKPLPPPPSRSDAETQALADQQRKFYAGSGDGRASTFLTGGGTDASSSIVRFLGGAGKT